MADRPPPPFPWLLIPASVLLVLVILYVLFVGYLPAKQRIAGLEAELKDLYRREAELQTKIAQQDQRYSVRERQISALTSERDTLIRRLEELEKLLGRAPSTPPRCPGRSDARAARAAVRSSPAGPPRSGGDRGSRRSRRRGPGSRP